MYAANIAALTSAFLVMSGASHAQKLGNTGANEKGDVVFRSLKFLPDYHSGIYHNFTDSNVSAPADTKDLSKHSVIEMVGFVSVSNGIVQATEGIETITLESFASAAQYWGDYIHPTTLPILEQRDALIATAIALQERPTPIDYVVTTGELAALVIVRYIYVDSFETVIDEENIVAMRSDAFVEWAYNSVGLPILGRRINIWPQMRMLQSWAEGGGLTPKDQLFRLRTAPNHYPSIQVLDGSTEIPDGGATTASVLTVRVRDALSAPGRLELYRNSVLVAVDNTPQNTSQYIYDSSDIGELGSLQEAHYQVRAIDQAGNTQTSSFDVDPEEATNAFENPDGSTQPDIIKSTNCTLGSASRATSGIAQWSVTGPSGFSAAATYSCPSPANPSVFGPFCLTTAGDYHWTSVSCAGVPKTSVVTVESASYGMVMELDGSVSSMAPLNENLVKTGVMTIEACISLGGICGGCASKYDEIQLQPGNSQFCPGFLASPSCCTRISNLAPGSRGFTVSNTTTSPIGPYTLGVAVYINKGGPDEVSVSRVINDYTGGVVGNVSIPDWPRRYPIQETISGAVVTTNPQSIGPSINSKTCSNKPAYLYKHLYPSIGCFTITGSQMVYASTAALSVSFEDSPGGIVTDTTTLAFYTYDGATWSSSAITSQSVTKSSVTGAITLYGEYLRTGEFGAFFNASDSSSPVTTFGFQGSTFAFDGTVFVSTDSYVVLTATDPLVNGFTMLVASTLYRMDATTSTAFYSVYASSIPLPLGTHVFEYYSYDWAGNTETVRTTTFTVTTGAGFRNTNNQRVMGSLLAGSFGSGAQTELITSVETAYTLIVSSINRSALASASNIGSITVGSQIPEGRLDLGQNGVALDLRSGNATSTGTAFQMTFGYNGDYSMRHALRTRHSTATDGNRMDFLLWSPAVGATTTVANVNVLSLQGISSANDGSFHVMPFGEPDAEVEVSNGSSLGGGTIQRLQVLTPSSRRFKSDIRYLDARQEDAALDAIAGMRHARFRYRSRDGLTQPLNVGLIYEEAPETIRAPEKTLSTVERVADLEMALKSALRQLEALEKRHAELKSRRRTP